MVNKVSQENFIWNFNVLMKVRCISLGYLTHKDDLNAFGKAD